MTITCKKLRLEEKRDYFEGYKQNPDKFCLLANLFGCENFNYIVSEDIFFERSLSDLVQIRVDVGWPPELEYRKICFSVGKRVFYIHKTVELK